MQTSSTTNKKRKQQIISNDILDKHNLLFALSDNKENKSWSFTDTENITNLIEKCNGYRWVNIREFNYNENWYTVLTYVCIILAFSSTIVNAITAFQAKSDLDRVVGLVVFVCTAVTTLLIAIIKQGDFTGKSKAFKHKAAKFHRISELLQLLQTVPPENRLNARSIFVRSAEEYMTLVESNPDIRTSTLKDYVKSFDGLHLIDIATMSKASPPDRYITPETPYVREESDDGDTLPDVAYSNGVNQQNAPM